MSFYDTIHSESELDIANIDSIVNQRFRTREEKSELMKEKKYRDWFVDFAQELNNIYQEFPKSPFIANNIEVSLEK